MPCLLMGGQACVLYGAAEFSRDLDLAVGVTPDALAALRTALRELDAEVIAVPPFETHYLARGHAVHFRCGGVDTMGLRIDVMSVMRGVAPMHELWERRAVFEAGAGEQIAVLGLADLVQAKKTQRDKDWPMIRRLLEADYFRVGTAADAERVAFWLRELRTPSLLVQLAEAHPAAALADRRPAVAAARTGHVATVQRALDEEMQRERDTDAAYWLPLRRELEQLRRQRRE